MKVFDQGLRLPLNINNEQIHKISGALKFFFYVFKGTACAFNKMCLLIFLFNQSCNLTINIRVLR